MIPPAGEGAQPPVDDLVSRLRALDSSAVSDALDKHGLPSAVSGLRPLAAQRAVAASRPGDVIVVAHQGRTDCAGWGGLLSRAAVIRGVDGVVVIPFEHAEAVLATAERIAATEAAMAAALDAGRPVSEVMGARYEELIDHRQEPR